MNDSKEFEKQIQEAEKIVNLMKKLPDGKRNYLLGVIDTLAATSELEEKETA